MTTSASSAAAPRRSRYLAYTTWIEQLTQDDPGARSALRGGLRRPLDDRLLVPRMHRFIAPWLPDRSGPDEQRAYYTIAALIAAQPRTSSTAADTPEEQSDLFDAAEAPAPTQGPQSAAPRYGTSLGTTFALAVADGPGRDKTMRESTAESRLNLLTRQSTNGLHRHLPASVSHLRDLDVPVDWAQLLDDLIAWPRHAGRISRRWLQDYYTLRSRHLREQAELADQQEHDAADTTQP